MQRIENILIFLLCSWPPQVGIHTIVRAASIQMCKTLRARIRDEMNILPGVEQDFAPSFEMLAWQWAGITTPNPAKLNVKAMLDIFMMASA